MCTPRSEPRRAGFTTRRFRPRATARLSLAGLAALTLACAPGPGADPRAPTVEQAVEQAVVQAVVQASLAGQGPVGRFPRIVSTANGPLVAWTAGDAGEARLQVARCDGTAWGEPELVARGEGWFVNWADCPTVSLDPEGTGLATWLVRNGESPYAYEIACATSPASPTSREWTARGVLHEDRSEAEHGFVSLVPLDAGWCAVWLDGRNTGGGDHASHDDHGGAMTLVTRTVAPSGELGPETTLDERVCDCCPTDAARLEDGTVVVVYRDRGADELRDVGLVRGRPDEPSSWSEPRLVHDDGWVLAGCPVNGPAVAAAGERVGVAWFTLGAEGRPRVLAALSEDGGVSFGEPLEIDGAEPYGRVDAAFVPGEPATLVVTWLGASAEGAEWRARCVTSTALGPVLDVAATRSGREAGALRIAPSGDGLAAVWTDVRGEPPRIRAARLELHPRS